MTLPDWLIERGIGEDRAVRISGDTIVEARIFVHGILPFGTIRRARLGKIGPPTIARVEDEEYFLPKGAPGVTEGASIRLAISREAIPGIEQWKRPQAVIVNADPPQTAPFEADEIAFPAPRDALEEFGWSDLIEEARSGTAAFDGGQLLISPTPAMTLIDIDGFLPRFDLGIAGARAAARTIARHGVGGSIGVDFPTISEKAPRAAIAEAFDAVMPRPFERTTVNAFGFLQIVRRRRHASLFELALDRAPFEARALLRRAGTAIGATTLAAHPAVIAAILPDWTAALERQIGGTVTLRADASLAMSGGHVH